MSWIWLGLSSWLVIGAAVGALARHSLPGPPPLGWASSLTLGLGGAVAGGLLATALGFGGLAGYDHRALVVATLSAVLALLILRLATLPTER